MASELELAGLLSQVDDDAGDEEIFAAQWQHESDNEPLAAAVYLMSNADPARDRFERLWGSFKLGCHGDKGATPGIRLTGPLPGGIWRLVGKKRPHMNGCVLLALLQCDAVCASAMALLN